jgi:transcriptional regulator with XRE-family HTH domain
MSASGHDDGVATKERPADRGTERGRRLVMELGREIRQARQDRGLSLADVGRAAGCSLSTVSRIERALDPGVSIVEVARLLAVVGLDLRARAYPGGQPVRDAVHAGLLERFRVRLHRSLGWAVEVPLPAPGDPRAWDGFVQGPGWRYGAEAETAPSDGQALGRRLQLKLRDGGVDGVLLIVPRTRRVRDFLKVAGSGFLDLFPVPGDRALELLAAGADPGGSAIIILPRD